jgi:hypothetical protein
MSEEEIDKSIDEAPAAKAAEGPVGNKKIADAEPEELVQALRHVVNPPPHNADLTRSARSTGKSTGKGVGDGQSNADAEAEAEAEADAELELEPAKEPEAKSGYKNPFHLFADVFYGVLIAPRQTLAILGDRAKFPPTFANLLLTFALVLFSIGLPAAMKASSGGVSAVEGMLKSYSFIFGNLFNWSVLSLILYYLSIGLRPNRLTLGNAFIVTGWAFLPFAFFAPVACFKAALGNGFIFLACVPAIWFLFLQWTAFQTALRVSNFKLVLIALVVPPVLCLIYLFWIGLAAFSLISQLIAHLS